VRSFVNAPSNIIFKELVRGASASTQKEKQEHASTSTAELALGTGGPVAAAPAVGRCGLYRPCDHEERSAFAVQKAAFEPPKTHNLLSESQRLEQGNNTFVIPLLRAAAVDTFRQFGLGKTKLKAEQHQRARVMSQDRGAANLPLGLPNAAQHQIYVFLLSCDSDGAMLPHLAKRLMLQAAALMGVCRGWRASLRHLSRDWVKHLGVKEPRKQHIWRRAASDVQRCSLAELPLSKRSALYEAITLEDRTNFFRISCQPITKRAEDDMEMVSDLVTWGERFLHHWEHGIYCCARCGLEAYSSADKWTGPCTWPSWRVPIASGSITAIEVVSYGDYECTVKEVYCSQCDLFLGHMFEDAREQGDCHVDARWRH
jgi:peptide-methionine (R)-S-oxide reductase